MALAVSEEAVRTLLSLEEHLEGQLEALRRGAETLERCFEENQAGLGAHSPSILALIRKLTREAALGPAVEKLRAKLQVSAQIRQDHLGGTTAAARDRESHYIVGVLGRMYADGYRELRRPRNGTWTGEVFHPEPKEVPALSNPEGKSFGQLAGDLERDYGLHYTGTPFVEGFADFSGIAVARLGEEEILQQHVLHGGTADPFLDAAAVDYGEVYGDRGVNFRYADQLAADKGLPIPGLAPGYTGADLAAWRKERGFTWDESPLHGYLLVPAVIHNNIPHTGLVSLMGHGEEAEQNITERLRRMKEKED